MKNGYCMTIPRNGNLGINRMSHRPTSQNQIFMQKKCWCAKIWWNQKNFIYYELLAFDETINSEYQKQLSVAIWLDWVTHLRKKNFFKGVERRKVILLHDNACWKQSWKSSLTWARKSSLIRCILLTIPHLFELFFRSLQYHLVDFYFKSFEKIDKNINEFINSKLTFFFRSEFHQLLRR